MTIDVRIESGDRRVVRARRARAVHGAGRRAGVEHWAARR
jgi:hypothetical protein